MDWSTVPASELLAALREVDWNQKPRPLDEFFTRFTSPKTKAKWLSRLKCNVYFYRVNYFCLVVLCFAACFLRRPTALLAAASACFTTLCLNDSFAAAVSERALRAARKLHPPLAVALRPPSVATHGTGAAGRAGRAGHARTVFLFGRDRRFVVALLYAACLALVVWARALATLGYACAWSVALVGAHASLRSPNLKARLATANEEFRATWRGYSEAP